MIHLAKLLFISLLPGIELRGSIPYGIATGMNPVQVVFFSVVANILLILLVFAALNFFWHLVKHWDIVKRYVERLRRRSKPYVDKYGSFGLFFFVSVPLPGSGVYTGVLIAWLLGMRKRDAFLPIMLGVFTAAFIVTVLTLSTVTILGI